MLVVAKLFNLTAHMGECFFDLKTNAQMDSLATCSAGSQLDRGHAGEKLGGPDNLADFLT